MPDCFTCLVNRSSNGLTRQHQSSVSRGPFVNIAEATAESVADPDAREMPTCCSAATTAQHVKCAIFRFGPSVLGQGINSSQGTGQPECL